MSAISWRLILPLLFVMCIVTSCGDDEDELYGNLEVDGRMCNVKQSEGELRYDRDKHKWSGILYPKLKGDLSAWKVIEFTIFDNISQIDLNENFDIDWFHDVYEISLYGSSYGDYKGSVEVNVNGNGKVATITFRSFSCVEYAYNYFDDNNGQFTHTIDGQVTIEYIID